MNCVGSGHAGMEIEAPAAHDLIVCIQCAALLVVADDLTLRRMTRADVDALSEDDVAELAEMQGRVRALIQRRAALN